MAEMVEQLMKISRNGIMPFMLPWKYENHQLLLLSGDLCDVRSTILFVSCVTASPAPLGKQKQFVLRCGGPCCVKNFS